MDLSPVFDFTGIQQLHRDRSRQIRSITPPATPPSNDDSINGQATEYALAHHALEGAEKAARTRDTALFDWYAAHPDTGAGRLALTTVAGPRIILSPDLSALPHSEISETPYYVIGPDTEAAPCDLQDVAGAAYTTALQSGLGDLLAAHAIVVCLLRRRALGETLDSWTIIRLPGTVFCDHVGDDVILARDLIHEASHNWLNDALTATESKIGDQTEFFSPWKQTMRPAFGYLHSCWAFPLIMIYTARVIDATNATPKGRFEAVAIRPCSVIQAGVALAPTPIIPNPPAADTAFASCPPATPAIGAHTTGTVTPRLSVSHVRNLASYRRDNSLSNDVQMAEAETDLVPVLTRWQDAGGIWRIVSQSSTQVTVSLCRCDGGEEVERLTSRDAGTLRFLTGRSSSED